MNRLIDTRDEWITGPVPMVVARGSSRLCLRLQRQLRAYSTPFRLNRKSFRRIETHSGVSEIHSGVLNSIPAYRKSIPAS